MNAESGSSKGRPAACEFVFLVKLQFDLEGLLYAIYCNFVRSFDCILQAFNSLTTCKFTDLRSGSAWCLIEKQLDVKNDLRSYVANICLKRFSGPNEIQTHDLCDADADALTTEL